VVAGLRSEVILKLKYVDLKPFFMSNENEMIPENHKAYAIQRPSSLPINLMQELSAKILLLLIIIKLLGH
jgi:hypothetical protein